MTISTRAALAVIAAGAALCGIPATGGQTLVRTAFAERPAAAPTVSAASTGPATHLAPATAQPWAHRWLDLHTFSHAERYRSTFNQGSGHLFKAGQQRSLLEGRLRLDSQAHYTIGFRASSGHYFNWAFADYAGLAFSHSIRPEQGLVFTFRPADTREIFASIATDPSGFATYSSVPSNGWYFYDRELYLSATPVRPVTLEFGSFGFERGFASEITTFDDDGYLSGERIRVRDPKHLYFDQVGYTNAFFGDVGKPSVFERGSSLKSFNYRQVFLKKQVSERVGVSGEYTWQIQTNSLREAAEIAVPESRMADSVRVELYQRLNAVNLQGRDVPGGAGFAIAFAKKISPRVNGDVGFASIDRGYTAYNGSRFGHAVGFSLNGDTYGVGQRPFAHASVRLNSAVTAFGFYTHAVGPYTVMFNKQGLNAGLSFDVKAAVNAEKKVF